MPRVDDLMGRDDPEPFQSDHILADGAHVASERSLRDV